MYKLIIAKDFGPNYYVTCLELWKEDNDKVFAQFKNKTDITKVFDAKDDLSWLEGSSEQNPHEVDLRIDMGVDAENNTANFTEVILSHQGIKDVDISDICSMPEFHACFEEDVIRYYFDVYNQNVQDREEAYEAQQEDRWREGYLAKKYGYDE